VKGYGVICNLQNLPSPLFFKEGNNAVPLWQRGKEGDFLNCDYLHGKEYFSEKIKEFFLCVLGGFARTTAVFMMK
jgi:hypothetical protein